jgi:hypothetical protein
LIVGEFLSDAQETFQRERVNQIADRMREISDQIERRVNELDLDIMSTRRDPEVKSLWNRLCLLHMRGIVICEEEYRGERPEACLYIEKPQACVKILQLAEEQTCCNRLLNRLSTSS